MTAEPQPPRLCVECGVTTACGCDRPPLEWESRGGSVLCAFPAAAFFLGLGGLLVWAGVNGSTVSLALGVLILGFGALFTGAIVITAGGRDWSFRAPDGSVEGVLWTDMGEVVRGRWWRVAGERTAVALTPTERPALTGSRAELTQAVETQLVAADERGKDIEREELALLLAALLNLACAGRLTISARSRFDHVLPESPAGRRSFDDLRLEPVDGANADGLSPCERALLEHVGHGASLEAVARAATGGPRAFGADWEGEPGEGLSAAIRANKDVAESLAWGIVGALSD